MTRTGLVTRRVLALLLLAALVAGPLLATARPARAAATFVVTLATDQKDLDITDAFCDVSTADGRQCTLRAAIQEANNTLGADTIRFNIPGAPNAVKVIKPNDPATPGGANGPLPFIAQRVTIDGYTQPGSSVNTAAVGTNAKLRIELDGLHTVNADGLRVNANAANTSIRGLAIGRFDDNGIEILADGVRITGCFVGTNAAGTNPRANAGYGVHVNGADDAVIGNSPLSARNLISGNGGRGLRMVAPGTGARVLGNLIGTNHTGTAPLGNGSTGVYTSQTDTRIGGDGAGEANVIQFNGDAGVDVQVPGTRNRILRNAIGANAGPGIDLNNDNLHNPNDAKDPDLNANNTQNFPLIAAAAPNLVQVTLNSNPDQKFFIRLYSNPGGGDEGVRYHGTFAVSTDPVTGDTGPVTLTPNPPIPAGRSVTATATRGNGDTSEFSDPVAVT